jgi:hypothetical protein
LLSAWQSLPYALAFAGKLAPGLGVVVLEWPGALGLPLPLVATANAGVTPNTNAATVTPSLYRIFICASSFGQSGPLPTQPHDESGKRRLNIS